VSSASRIDDASLDAVQGLYDRLSSARSSSPREAELTKLLEKHVPHVNIALVNELAMFADDLGSTCGRPSTRPRPAVRVHALHAGTGASGAIAFDRPVVPVVAGAPVARARSGSSSWPTTSTTTCPTTWCAAWSWASTAGSSP